MTEFQTVRSLSLTDVSYSLRDFLDKFTLPQLARVQEGYYDEYQRTTVGSDGVYNFLGIESVETVLLEDADGEECRIPLDYPCTVERAAEERFQQQLNIQDLLRENHPAVKFVRVVQSDPNFETLIKAGEKLKIDVRKKKPHDNFLSFKKVSDKGKTSWKVPVSSEVKFQGLWDGEELSLCKFVKKNKLPAFVSFIHNSLEQSGEEEELEGKERRIERTSPPLPTGVVKLKGILVDSCVTATTEANGVTSTFSFPKTLPISVVPVKMGAPGSLNIESKSASKVISEVEYEDMSGFQVKMLRSPHLKTPHFQGEGSDKTTVIEELGGPRIRRGNTYSPPPPFKVTRSKSMIEQRKGNDSFQRAVSNLELRTKAITESEENVYEELNFSQRNPSLPRLLERRRSDSNKDQISAQQTGNLNNLLHEFAQNMENESFHGGKVETVSLQIRKTPPASHQPSNTMKTFGRREKTAETEILPGDVQSPDAILESQSKPTNQLPLPNEVSHALHGSHVRRSSEGALSPLPVVPESSAEEKPQPPYRHLPSGDNAESKGRHRLNCDELKGLPKGATIKKAFPEIQQNEKSTNHKSNEQSSLAKEFEKNVVANEGESRKSRTSENETPPPVPPRHKQTGQTLPPDVPLKADSSADEAVENKERQPITSTKDKSHSFHGQEQGEDSEVFNPDKKPSGSVSRPLAPTCPATLSGSSHALNLHKINEERNKITGEKPTPKPRKNPNLSDGPQKTDLKIEAIAFDIPEDLSTLRVAEVLQCLKAINMQQFEKIFKEQQVDGSILVYLDEEALQSFGMDRFHRLKLLRFIAGWRPEL